MHKEQTPRLGLIYTFWRLRNNQKTISTTRFYLHLNIGDWSLNCTNENFTTRFHLHLKLCNDQQNAQKQTLQLGSITQARIKPKKSMIGFDTKIKGNHKQQISELGLNTLTLNRDFREKTNWSNYRCVNLDMSRSKEKYKDSEKRKEQQQCWWNRW